MRRFVRALLAAWLALTVGFAPIAAEAQRVTYSPPAAAGGANQNLDNSYENCGFNTDGQGTTITANSSANVEGSTSASVCTTGNAWRGFKLYIGSGGASASRDAFDISLDGGSTWVVNDVYIEPSQALAPLEIWFPLQVPASADIRLRMRSSSGSGTVKVALAGYIGNAQSPPVYTAMDNITALDTANTRATSTDVPLTTSDTAFTQSIASTSQTYGAIMLACGHNGSTPATPQTAKYSLATGAGGSETIVYSQLGFVSNGTTPCARQPLGFVQKTIASGTRLSVQVDAATPGTDNLRIAVYGFR